MAEMGYLAARQKQLKWVRKFCAEQYCTRLLFRPLRPG